MENNETDEIIEGFKDMRTLHLVEALSKLIGTTVSFKVEGWDEDRKLFKKSYVSKVISAVELEIEPVRHVTFTFVDGTSQCYFSMTDFECLIGKFGEYGSIWEYLSCEASTLFR